ncbi:hypothetical protein RN001_001855 [Aquatica leii]|uniref:RNA polymerase II subunit A C-terminal domain phosphatase n=1 Tax=Aquatica leii TaxID=1421715 RepID=A0AAN7SLI7_9COLE|nr:hypothetical protein RN001_001855 [Aquatica leii]
MAEKTVVISQQSTKPIKIVKWKVREGFSVSIGSVVLLYDFEKPEKKQQLKLKSSHAGTVCKIIAQEGAIISPGESLLELKACIHPTVMKDMCAECGADLRKDDLNSTASVPMVHTVPELKVSEELAQKLGKADGDRLLRDKKLVLLVDLDQTLIHTTNDIIPPNLKDVYHFQLYGPSSPWYHTRLRPGTHQFLTNVSPYFELHICTFGARNYAHKITAILDGDERFFSNRVLSRDECFNPTSKTANLKALFPCGDHMVCIIDDREDVWSHASNLIHVKPYHFFKHTGDINAPPGLEKHENDEKEGVDLSKMCTIKDSNETENEKNNHNNEDTCDKNSDTFNSENTAEQTVESEKINTNSDSEIALKEVNGEDKSDSTIGNKDEVLDKSKIDDKTNPELLKLKNENDVIEVEDPDDYLLYLEDILIRIHKAFYDEYDRLESGEVPDLKKVIPEVKSKVLQGCKMIFSGLVPTHIKLHHSRAYQVAKTLGAIVAQEFEDDTTHLVAVRPGTAKVNTGRRKKNLKIVTPDWLWACAERWEHVDEKIFPLNSKGSKNRHPPPHCSSPEHIPNYNVHETPTQRKRSSSGRFIDTINPLMSFSTADIADMDKEVEDTLDTESESEDENAKALKSNILIEVKEDATSTSSSSGESLTAETPKGYKRNLKKRNEDEESDVKESDDEFPSTKFRRGEELGSDLDIGQESNSDGSAEPPDEIDDGEWNMMGAALEREFLSN